MKNYKKLILLIAAIALSDNLKAQSNLGFEDGFSGWKTDNQENVTIITDSIHNGKAAVKIGTSNAEVRQQIAVGQLTLVSNYGYAKASKPGTVGYLFIRFYDDKNHLLIEYKSNDITSLNYKNYGIYTETPVNTQYMVVGVEKTEGDGYIYADDFAIRNNIGESFNASPPLVNLDQYMKPFWKGDTVYNETVLMYAKNGQSANGRLLFQPDQIIAVKSFDLKRAFEEGKDYALKGNLLTKLPGSDMPFRTDTSFSHKDMAWFNTQGQYVVVTYTHHDKWQGLVPAYEGNNMPYTTAKLKTKAPLTIVAFGMSITRGMNVSGYDNVPPYMPTYIDMFTTELKKNYHSDIRLYNAGLPGAKIDWGAKYTDEYVNALKPDLVIVDFGMNDFTQFTGEQFKTYALTIISKLKKANPKVEIMLLSNMKFDPEYLSLVNPKRDEYMNNMIQFNQVFKSLTGRGIINLDMTDISDLLFSKKKPKDCIANPLHPNDYMARWYAQGMASLLIKYK